MDIWSWVHKLTDELEESGQERLASLFYRIVNLVCDNEISQVEALLPEALAAAKAMENLWVEVYFRHQEMRLRLGLKGEGASALPDVVDLLEFSHRKECAECPQAMCTTQDISSCYANIDGPGWAEERIAVSREGLAKIDPTWSCYSCLTLEYLEALCDQQKYAEALELFTAFQKKQREFGEEIYVFELHSLVNILTRLGRLEEALAELDAADKMTENENRVDLRIESQLLRARIYADMGRKEDAWEALPNFIDVMPGDYGRWLHIAFMVVSGDKERNNWSLGGTFQAGLEHMNKVGRHRDLIDTGADAVRLAFERGSVSTPRRVIALMKRHLPKLRLPLGADELIAGLEAELARMPRPELPVPAAELVKYLSESEHGNAEQGLDWLYTAMDELPEDTNLLFTACSALSAMRAYEDVRSLLWDYLRRYPEDSENVVDELIRHTPEDMPEELERLADYIQQYMPHMADWTRLYMAYRSDSLEDVEKHAKIFLEKMPESRGARVIWANTAMINKDFATAARIRQEALDIELKQEEPSPNHFRWDILVAAACNGDWKLVRDTCIDMGFDVEAGDTPIDEPGEYVRIQYTEDGEWRTSFAQRNGPVTARITSCSWPRQVQRLGDLVVFDPAPLEDEPEDEEEKKYFYTPYSLVHILEKGNKQCWLVDGAFPGDKAWDKFCTEMEEKHGFVMDRRSDGDYTVNDPAEAEQRENDPDYEAKGLPGVYFLLGVPDSLAPAELDGILTKATKNWEHPMCWYSLAEAAGKPTEPHQALIDKYGL